MKTSNDTPVGKPAKCAGLGPLVGSGVHLSTIWRRGRVEAETGYSRSTIYLRIEQHLFTRPVSLGARAVGWPAAEVVALNAARIAGKADAEIRSLVADLESARAAVAPSARPVGAEG